uniref:RNA helicase n=1 Tax=Rhabditophanes sp. KR3021 TaxID=114890 RepID=A0AC35TTV1_9BILA
MTREKKKEKGPSGRDFTPRSFIVEEKVPAPLEYKVIGNDALTVLKKASMTLSWVENATTFQPGVSKEASLKLKLIANLSEELKNKVKVEIKRYFPVQGAVLPGLIDESVMPLVLPPRDVAISAPTGSGKTLCFVLPILNSLLYNPVNSIHAIIMVPVNQLVEQITAEFAKFAPPSVNIVGIANSKNHQKERSALFSNNSDFCTAHIIISTPTRLMEHLADTDGKDFDLSRLRYLVVDEADQMANTARLDWLNTVEQKAGQTKRGFTLESLNDTSGNRFLQKILVSATLNKDVEALHMWNLRYPRLFHAKSSELDTSSKKSGSDEEMDCDEIENALYLPAGLSNEMVVSDVFLKPLVIYYYLMKHPEWKSVIVFSGDKERTNRLPVLLNILFKNANCAQEVSSNIYGNERKKIISKFVDKKIRVLVCSDVMSRGVDVPNVDCVINYGKPIDERQFIHRAGRTARAGKAGFLLTVVTKEEKFSMKGYLSPSNLWDKIVMVQENPVTTGTEEAFKLKEMYKIAQEKYKKSMAQKK